MRKEQWRRELSSYPVQVSLPTRYADIDVWRHLNNVAAVALHQEARVRWLCERVDRNAWFSNQVLLRPSLMATDFLAEGRYPGEIIAAARCTGHAADSLGLATALFQNGVCIGLQQTQLQGWFDGQPVALPEHVRAALATRAEQPVLHAAVADEVAAADPGELPWQVSLSSRFGDTDGDAVMGEVAISRLLEQARVVATREGTPAFHECMKESGLGLVVANVTVRHLQQRRAVPVWNARAGMVRVGDSSFTVRVALYRREELMAVSDSVLVVVDRRATRPAGLPPEAREALQAAMLASHVGA